MNTSSLSTSRICLTAILFCVTIFNVVAATIQSTTTGGNWNNPATWVGGVVPLASDDVVIATTTGNQVTLTAPASCAGLVINTDATLVTGTHLLSISGDFIRIGTLTSGTGGVQLTGTADQLISGFTTSGNLTMAKTGGTATLAGDVNAVGLTINGSGGSLNLGLSRTHTFTGVVQLTAGTLQGSSSTLNANFTGSAWAGTGTVFVAGTSTVVLGGGAQTISTTTTFHNLTFGGTGSKTLAAATTTTVNGTFTIANGTNINTYTGALVYGANAGLRYSVGTNTRATNNTEWPSPFVALGGVTIEGTSPGAITLNASKQLGNNTNVPLTINTGGTLTLGSSALTLHGDFINSATLNAGANAVNISGTVATQNIAGFTSTGTITVNKASGTVNFTGGINVVNLTVNGAAAVVNMGSNTHTISSVVTITAGTLNCGSSNISLNNVTGAGTLNGDAANFTFTGSGTISARGITTTGNILINRGGNTLTFAGDLNANNITNQAGTISLGTARNHTFTGLLSRTGGTLNFGTNTTITLSGSGIVISGTIAAGTNTTVVLAGGAQTINTSNTYINLTLAGSGAKTINNTQTINGILTISNGNNVNTWAGSPTYVTSSTLVYDVGSANRTASSEWTGTFPGSGGVIIKGTGIITMNNAKTIGNGTAASQLVIDPGATLATNNFGVTLAGNFINNGTFTAGSSNITISGTLNQTIAGFTTTGNVSMTKTASTATLTGAVSAAALTINGVGGTLNMGAALSHTFSGIWTRTNGTLDLNSSSIAFTQGGAMFSGTGGAFVAGTGTVIFSGAAQTCPVLTYHNLTLANSGTKTFATSPTVNGVLQLDGSADVVVTTGIVTYGTLATLRYNRTAAYTTTLEEFPATFSGAGGVIVSGSGVITFNANKFITYKLNIHTGSIVNLGNGLTHDCKGLIRGGSAPAAGQFGATGSGASTIDDVFFASSSGILNSSNPSASWKLLPVSSNWHDINNWDEGMIPDAFTDAIIPTGSSLYPTLSADAETRNLEINTGATLTTAGFQLTLNGNYTNSGTLTLGSSNVVLAGALDQSIAVLSTTGTVTSIKTAATATLVGALSSNGLIINGTGGTVNLGTSLTHTINGNITLIAGTLNGGSATLSINGNISGAATLTGNACNFTLTGSSDQSIVGFTTTGNINFSKSGGTATFAGDVSAAQLTMNGTGATLDMGSGRSHSFSGNVTLTNGTLLGGNNTITLTGTASWLGTGANFTPGTSTVVFSGAAQTIGGNTTFNNLTNAGTAGKTYAAGTTTINGIHTLSQNTNTFAGSVAYGPAAGIVYSITAARTAVANEWPVTFTGTGGVTVSGSNILTAPGSRTLDNNVNLTVNSGATLALGANQLTVRNDISNNGSITTSTGGSIRFLGTNAQSLSGTGTTSLSGGDILMNKTGGMVTLNNNINVRNITLNGLGGTLDFGTGRSHTIQGNYTVTAGTAVFNNANITITGTATQSIAGIVTTGNISMTKTGGTATLTGDVNAANLTINGAGGTLNLGSGLNHTFSGTWAQLAGTLNGGSSTVTFTSASAPTGSSSFVAGTSTVIYSGAAQTVRNTTYHNLVLGGSGVKTVSASVIVNNVFTLEGTATVSTAFTYGGNATLRYNKTSSYTTTNSEFPALFTAKGGVIVAGTGPIVLNGNKTIVAPLQIESGASIDLVTFTGHSSEGLTLGGVPQTASTYGHSSSAAATTNDLFFANNTGIINVTNPNATWLGITNNWHTATNWSNGFVPNLSANVTINSGTPFQPTLTAAAFCGNLSIEPGATLTTDGFDLNIYGDLTNNGTLTLGSSNVILNGNTAQTIPTISTSGNLSMLKTSNTASITGNLNVGSIILNGAAGTLDLGTAFTHTLTGNLTITAGTLLANNNNIVLSGTANQSIAGFVSTGIVTCAKTGGTATFTSAGDFTNIEVTGTGGTLHFGNTGLTHTIRGNVTITAGSISGGNANITLTGNANQSIAGFATTGNITATKSSSTATFTGNMGFNNLALTAGASSGIVNLGSGTTHTFTGNITVATMVLNGNDASLIANGTGAQALPAITTTGSITCAKTADTLTLSGTSSYANINVTVAGGTLSFGSAALTVSGNITRSAGTLIGSTSSITFSGTGSSLVDGFSTTGTITLTKTSGGTLTFNGNMSMGNLTLNGIGGILELGDGFNHTITGILTRTNGTIDCGNSILTFTGAGAVITGSSGSFLPGNSTIVFNNAGAQTLAPLTYNNLTLAGGGVKTTASIIVQGVLRLQGTATVSDPITYGPDATLEYVKPAAYTTTDNEFPAVFTSSGGVVNSGAGIITFNNSKTITATLTIASGSKIDLNGITTHSTNGLVFGVTAQSILGTYGVTGSGADNINNDFLAGTSGRILLSTSTTTWLGNTFVWEDEANWSNGVPTSVKDVVLVGSVTQPILASPAIVKDLKLNVGTTLISSGLQISIFGNLENEGTLNLGSSPIIISGTADQTIDGFTTTGNVTVTKLGGTATLNGNLNVNSVVMNAAGATLDFGADNTHTLSGNLTLIEGSLVGNSSNIVLSGTASQNIAGFTSTGTLTSVKSAGIATLTGNMTLAAITLNGNGSTLNLGTATTHIISGNVAINNGTLNGGGATLNLQGNLTGAATITGNAMNLELVGTNTQSIRGFSSTGNLSVLKTGGTATLTSPITINQLVLNGPGATLNMGTSLSHQINGDVVLTAGNLNGASATINISSNSATAWTGDGSLFTPASSTVVFTGVDQTINTSTTFNNLTLAGTGIKTFAPATTTTINGTHTIANANHVNEFTDATIAYGPTAAIRYNVGSSSRTTSAEWPATFASTGGIVIDGTSGGVISLNEAKVIGNSNNTHLTINSGATLNTNNHALSLHGNLVRVGTLIAGSSTITLEGNNATQTIAGFTTTGNLVFTKGAGVASMGAGVSAGSLTINGAGATLNLATGSTNNFAGNVSLTAGTLNANNATLIISASGANAWSGNGSVFNRGTSTVRFTGASAEINASTNFYRLEISGTGTAVVSSTIRLIDDLVINQPVDLTTNASTFVFNAGLGETQLIVSNQNPTTFHILEMDNTSLVFEDNPVAVNGSLILTNGELQPGVHNLIVRGSIARTDGSILLGSSRLIMNGSASQTIPANTFTDSNAYELEINNGAGVALGGPVRVLKALFLTNGQLNTNDHLILKSDMVGSARIAPLGAGGSIIGNVRVQRFIDELGADPNLRRWRFLSSPVQNETVAGWKRTILVTGPGGASNGFDASPNNAHSIFWYNETVLGNVNQGWVGPANSSHILPVGRGYRVFVRGDRTISPSMQFTTNFPQTPVTMDAYGPVNTGTINIPLTLTLSGPGNTRDTMADGWNLVGNPYPSAIDWKHFWDNALPAEKNNIWPIIYLYSGQSGNYRAYNAEVDPELTDLNVIPSGASFWVRAIGASPTLVLKEINKTDVDASSAPVLFKTTDNSSFTLRLVRDSFNYDLLSIRYKDSASVYMDKYDIPKMFGGVTISSWLPDSMHLSQNVRPLMTANDTIRLNVNGGNGTHRIEFINGSNISVSDNIYLVDQFTSQVVDVKTTPHYTFSISNNAASRGMNRFYIVVQSPQSVPVKMLYFNAQATADKKVSVNWATSNEINSKQFVVERSLDARNFEAIGNVEAAGNSSQIINYNFMDNKPLRVGFYRIKQVDIDGTVEYSEIRRVSIDGAAAAISVYPNPATEFVRVEAASNIGKLEVIDGFGRIIKSIEAKSNMATVDVKGLMSGIYFLRWIDENGSAQVHGFMVE